MLFASVHLSPSTSLYSVVRFFLLWQYLCLSRQHLCTKSKTFLLGGYQGHNALVPSTFFRIFSKNSDNFVEIDRTSEKFFDGNSNSRKVKMTVCMRWRVAYSFKAPSANAPAATARRLVSNSLVSGFRPIPFQEHSSDHSDSGPK
jgi:hypothetical protein